MTCAEFEAYLGPYVDGELGAGEMAAADSHARGCPACAALLEDERRFRQLLRLQPRESAPPELRQRVLAAIRRSPRRRALRAWSLASVAAAAAALLAWLILPLSSPTGGLARLVVDKHLAHAQLERPAELVSEDRDEVAAWLVQRGGLRVAVADYRPAGIRLVGARVTDVGGQRAAYILYRKGHVLLSVFMVPVQGHVPALGTSTLPYQGRQYAVGEHRGIRTVAWAQGTTVFSLASALDFEALLECADRLRSAQGAGQA
jgi:anti-sigma factor RsiW